MEQTNQQTIQKLSIPIKTKIAAWWMIAIGGFQLLLFLYRGIWGFGSIPATEYVTGIFGIFFLIYPGFLILKRKKVGWLFAIIVISIILIYLLFLPALQLNRFFWFLFLIPFSAFLFVIPPIILLLLDRKNFWKIAN